MREIELLTGYCNLDFIGLLSSRMPVSLFYLVMNVKELVIGKHREMPTNYSLDVEPFDVWGFDYMGPFPSSNGYTHILVAIDYVTTNWVEAIPTSSVDHKTSIKILKEVIFPRFGVP